MKLINTLGLSLALLSLARAAGKPDRPPLAHELMGVANGCFVESVAFLDHWQEAFGAEPWARMLQWGAKADEEIVAGHAVAVCEARGKLWCWDINFGWTPLAIDPAQRENTELVAAPILAHYPKISARYPTFRYDFPQAPAASPPVAQPGAENASLRDASIVAERLARHRPVNLVRFKLPAEDGGEAREGAAVVFLFNGRYCIYIPEFGTTPFRARGGVENLRLIHELLRRELPGASELQKM